MLDINLYDLFHIHLWSETVKCIIGDRIRNLECHAFCPGHNILADSHVLASSEGTAN